MLSIPDTEDYASLAAQAVQLGVGVSRYASSQIQEKPLMLRQQRWNLEDDSGNDTWVGAAFATVVREHDWATAFMMPLTNMLIEPAAACASLELHRRESFDFTAATELISGAGWYIFEADLLNGLMNSHADLMWARGGLAWAIRKPLYPFKSGAYHNPRIRPSLQVDLRLNSFRAAHTIGKARCDDFASPGFSYGKWLMASGWETPYCDFSPLIVNIEPANICNASCYACVYPQMQRPRVMMTQDIFAAVLDAFKPGDDCRWIFSGMGEPLLNPFLAGMISSTAAFSSMLVTSLQKLPGEEFPLAALDQIRISADGLAEEDFMQKRPGCSWKNIELFLNLARARKRADPDRFPEIGISCVRHGMTEGQMQAFINYWKQVVKPVFRDNFFRWPFDQQPEQVQWYQILGEAVYGGMRRKTSRVDFKPVRRRPCRNALLGVTVLSDGRVTICPYDFEGRYAYGDIRKDRLRDIWLSEVARSFRSRHLQAAPDMEPCSACGDWYHPI